MRMDPNAVVLDISSDEEVGWDGHGDRVIGGFDDSNWIAELLDEVNRGDSGNRDGSEDSDDVVVVSEVLPSRKPRKKPTSKSSSLVELDDDCVVLDHDPGKPKVDRNENPIARIENGDDDSDDLLVVSETGQVACRDYPHPRHLCIKFPFSSTPNESHCNQCYCYVCDSLAPCLYWGNGSATIDHCLATEKLEFWKLERQNSMNKTKSTSIQPTNSSLSNHINISPPPPMAHIPVPRPNPIRVCPATPFINQIRPSFLIPRNKYQPGLVSQQLIRTRSCTIPGNRVHHNYNLTTPFDKPVFKRTVSPGVYRHPLNNSASFPPPYLPLQPELNSDSYVPPIPFQPSLSNYSTPYEASCQGNQGQRSAIDPKFFHDINWPESGTNHLPAAQSATPANESPVVAPDSGELYDNWGYEDGSMEIPGSYGLNEFSPEPGFLDSGTFFDF